MRKAPALLLILLSTCSWSAILDDCSVYIDFEDRVSDQSGNSHTCNLQGSSNSYVTGRIGTKAMLFGTGGYVSIADAGSVVDNTDELSWAGWFKRPDTSTAIDNIVFKSSVYKLRVDTGGDGEWSGYVMDSGAHSYTPTSTGDAAETTEWVHVAMTASLAGANSTIKYYINGSEVSSSDQATFTDLMGNTGDSGSVGTNTMTVDDFYIWTRVVTPEEIAELADLPEPTATPTVTNTPVNTPTPTNTATPTATTVTYKYIRKGASGSADGSDWTNAYDEIPATLTRGATYLVADGNYTGDYTFNDANDGTKVITIQKATTASHGTETGWDGAYGDGVAHWQGYIQFTTDYFTLDGVTGGGPGSWETGHGFAFDYTGWHSCHLEGARHDITLMHCDFESGGRDSEETEDQIFYGIGGPYNITIQYCWMHDVRGCQIITRSGHDYLIEYNKMNRNGGGGITSHREAWSGSNESDVIFRYNFLEDISNSGMICLVNGNGNADNWEIYGNVFSHSMNLIEEDNQISPAVILTKYSEGTTIVARNWQIYNNTFCNIVGNPGLRIMEIQTLDGIGVKVRNNLWYNNIAAAIHQPSDTANLDIDYSYYADNRTSGEADLDVAAAAAEDNSTAGTGSPFTDNENNDYTLSAAIAGVALDATYETDAYNETRGGDGTWDIGAYELNEDYTPTPTATNTDTHTPTPTDTATATFTATATPTATFTVTFTPTITDTPTITETPTVTNTRTVTPTRTITPTPTVTPTGGRPFIHRGWRQSNS